MGIQYTPVDSRATVSTPQAISQVAIALRSSHQTRVPAHRLSLLALPPSGSMRPHQFPQHWGKYPALSLELPCCAPQWLTNDSVMKASNLTHSHKRDAHRCAHQCRRRFPDHAQCRAHPTVAITTASSHQCFFGHFGAAIRFLAQIRAQRWPTYALVSLGTPGPLAGLGCSII